MTQAQERTTVQPALIRSEQFLDHIEQSIGTFAVLTRQRFQQTLTRSGERVASIQTELTARSRRVQGQPPDQVEGQVAERKPLEEMQRAEGLVDTLGQRLTLWTSRLGLQIRKMAAYTREGAEDMLAEAASIPNRSRIR